MGINKADFVEGFKTALCDPSIADTLKALICQPLQSEITGLKDLISEQNKRIEGLEKKVTYLERKCDENEQYSRRNSLRIHGVKEESEENLTESIKTLLNKELALSPPITNSDIDRVHRIGPRGPDINTRPRQCILKLTSYQTRARIFNSRTKLRHAANKMYINEDLTKPRADLLWTIRNLKREKKISDGWSHDGKIYVKLGDGKIVYIKDKNHLNELTLA